MSFGFLRDLLLGGGDCLADAADLEVEIGEAVLENAELGSALRASLYSSTAWVA